MGRVGELSELAETEERDLLADVDRVVADALEGAGRPGSCACPNRAPRVVRELGDLEVHVAVEPVDRIVHLRQPRAELEVPRRSASIATRTMSTTMCPISPICWTIAAFLGRFELTR
jgi:hypothetical protein